MIVAHDVAHGVYYRVIRFARSHVNKLVPYSEGTPRKPPHNDSVLCMSCEGSFLSLKFLFTASVEYDLGRSRSAWCMSIQYPVDIKCGYDTNTSER